MDSPERQKKSTDLLTDSEVEAIESRCPDGISSAEIVEAFTSRGVRFSEASFRKYVQLGLLPRSHRIGTKGKHKGSRGIYPSATVRQINEIKRMMLASYTIEEIRQHLAFVGGEIEELRKLLEQVFRRLEESLSANQSGMLSVASLKQQLAEARNVSEALVRRLGEVSQRIRELRKVAREAV